MHYNVNTVPLLIIQKPVEEKKLIIITVKLPNQYCMYLYGTFSHQTQKDSGILVTAFLAALR